MSNLDKHIKIHASSSLHIINSSDIIRKMKSHYTFSAFAHKCLKFQTCYKWQYKYQGILITLYTLTNQIQSYVQIINHVIDIYTNTSTSISLNRKTVNALDIHIFPVYTCNKSLPDKANIVLSTINVNSGYCISKRNQPSLFEIYVFRAEEHIKVLIHELIHALGLDRKFNDYDLNHEIMFNINGRRNRISSNMPISLCETYTEILALLIYSRYYHLSIHTQIEHSLITVAKILRYYEYNSLLDLSKGVFKQRTNVLSYYILKASVLYNLFNYVKYQLYTIYEDCQLITVMINYILHISVSDFIHLCCFQSTFITNIDSLIKTVDLNDRSLKLSYD